MNFESTAFATIRNIEQARINLELEPLRTKRSVTLSFMIITALSIVFFIMFWFKLQLVALIFMVAAAYFIDKINRSLVGEIVYETKMSQDQFRFEVPAYALMLETRGLI